MLGGGTGGVQARGSAGEREGGRAVRRFVSFLPIPTAFFSGPKSPSQYYINSRGSGLGVKDFSAKSGRWKNGPATHFSFRLDHPLRCNKYPSPSFSLSLSLSLSPLSLSPLSLSPSLSPFSVLPRSPPA